MSEQNKALVRLLMEEAVNKGNLAAAEALVADDFVAHTTGRDYHGWEEYRQFFVGLRNAFSDLQARIEDQVAEGDRVVTRFRAVGTHTGEFAGIPATGRRGEITGIDIDRIVDGRFVECWSFTDDLGLLRQLGVVSEPANADRPKESAR